MNNPLNPLNWIKTAQDWFSKTERSSGFRPFLIYLILIFGLSMILITSFNDNSFIVNSMIFLILGSCAFFIIIFIIKSLQEPDFCRSEYHIQRMQQFEIEKMGNESKQVEAADIINAELVEDNSLRQIPPTSSTTMEVKK